MGKGAQTAAQIRAFVDAASSYRDAAAASSRAHEACINLRIATEKLVEALALHFQIPPTKDPRQRFDDRVRQLNRKVPKHILSHLRTLQTQLNAAAHADDDAPVDVHAQRYEAARRVAMLSYASFEDYVHDLLPTPQGEGTFGPRRSASGGSAEPTAPAPDDASAPPDAARPGEAERPKAPPPTLAPASPPAYAFPTPPPPEPDLDLDAPAPPSLWPWLLAPMGVLFAAGLSFAILLPLLRTLQPPQRLDGDPLQALDVDALLGPDGEVLGDDALLAADSDASPDDSDAPFSAPLDALPRDGASDDDDATPSDVDPTPNPDGTPQEPTLVDVLRKLVKPEVVEAPHLVNLSCAELNLARNALWRVQGYRFRDPTTHNALAQILPGAPHNGISVVAARRNFTPVDRNNEELLRKQMAAESCAAPSNPRRPSPE